MKQRNKPVPWAFRLYAALLMFYPPGHQRAFGAQMLQTFKDQYKDVRETEGTIGLGFWIGVITDDMKNIVKEHLTSPTTNKIALMGMMIACLLVAFVLLGWVRMIAPVGGLALFAYFARRHQSLYVSPGHRGAGWKKWSSLMFVVGLCGLFVATVYWSANGPNTQCTTPHDVSAKRVSERSYPPSSLTTAIDYFQQGDYDYDTGDCKKALADYTQAISLNPQYAEAYNNRAYTRMMQDDYKDALPDLDHALAIRPTYIHALMNRGDIYNYYYNVDRRKALVDYTTVIALGGVSETSVCGHKAMAESNHIVPIALFRLFTDRSC